MCVGYFVFFEHDVEGVNAMVVLNDAAGATDFGYDYYLGRIAVTLNLFSFSSLNRNEVGPI